MTTKAEVLRTIRAKCLDCSVYQPSEVTKCAALACPLWPFRMGKDPNPARRGNVNSLPSRRREIAV